MNTLLSPEVLKILHRFWYRFRFLSLYIVFGALSLLIELSIRSQLQQIGFHLYTATTLSLILGMLFAFFGNTYFNFRIPRSRRNRAFIYFVSISLLSLFIQWLTAQLLHKMSLTYEQGRLFISGALFLIGYLLHRRFTFRDFKRVGVAIYANGVENLKEIHERIGQFPDFIHVDIVDKTFSREAAEAKVYRMETIKAFWPNREIHTHIMSKYPSRWLPEILPYSDTVFIHWECEEEITEIIKLVQQQGKKAGVAICIGTVLEKAQKALRNADAVLLLTIPEPGRSGQKFDMSGLDSIEKINKWPFRNQLRICVDGGIDEKIVVLLQAEDVVSGSSVLNHFDPKRQIMKLQTAGRYEAS